MALATHGGSVLARERELGGSVVIEACSGPLCRGVAHGAVLGESARGVRRVEGLGEVGAMAIGAFRRCAGPLAANVALGAIDSGVGATELEPRQVVVEFRVFPLGGRMAVLAGAGEASTRVVGIGRLFKVRQVATGTVHRRAREAARRMAARAVADGSVRSRQSELRGGVVIELCSLPGLCRMAEGAIARKVGSGVIGDFCGVEVGAVTTETVGGSAFVLERVVTGVAFQRGVTPGEGVSGEGLVVEFRLAPGIEGVAAFAVGGEPGAAMVYSD